MKKNRLTMILIVAFVLILVGALVIGLYITNELSKASKTTQLLTSGSEAYYHLMVILDDSYKVYDEQFEEGLITSGEQYKIATEIIWVEGAHYNEKVFEALDRAYYTQVDGVILHGFSDDQLIKRIDELHQAGIAVITLNEDLSTSARISYVGINQYNMGQTAAKLLSERLEPGDQIALIGSKHYENNNQEDMLVLGINDYLKENTQNSLQLIAYTMEGVFSAESVAVNIFKSYPDIRGIYCVDEANTLGVVQALIDNNVVNDYVLLGSGDNMEILNYIQKGKIIEGVIITDYEEIAKKAVQLFYESRNTLYVSSYVDTKITKVTKDNIDSYLDEMGDGYEEIP